MNTNSPSEPNSPGITVDPAGAQAALLEIERVAQRLRQVIASGPASAMLILWGAVWGLGFGITEFAPEKAGLGWLVLDVLGIFGSVVIGFRTKSSLVSSGRADVRFFFFWLALFLYAGIWFWMFRPSDGNRIGAYWATVPMFAYVVGGLWLSRFFTWLGMAVTVLTILGLTLIPAHFNLLMSLVGGGSLVVSGIYIRKAWR